MLPYVDVADLDILGIHLHPFGLLLVTAIVIGTALARWPARQRGFDLQKLESFIGWMLFTVVPRIRKPKVRIVSADFSYLRTDEEVRRFLVPAHEEDAKVFAFYAAAV